MGAKIGPRPPGELPEGIPSGQKPEKKGHEQKVDTIREKLLKREEGQRSPRLARYEKPIDFSQLQKTAEGLKIKYEHLRDFLSLLPKINKDNANIYAETIFKILRPVSPDQQREFVKFLSEKIKDTATAFKFQEAFDAQQELQSIEKALQELRDFQ